jgi:hypothetical protein
MEVINYSSLSSPWQREWEDAKSLLHKLEACKLRQKWFADYDFGKASSIFWCFQPDAVLCNIRGESITQECVFGSIGELSKLQALFIEKIKPLKTKRAGSLLTLCISEDMKQRIRIGSGRRPDGHCGLAIREGSNASAIVAEAIHSRLGEILKQHGVEVGPIESFSKMFMDDGIDISCDSLETAFELRSSLCSRLGDKGELTFGLDLDSPYYDQLPHYIPFDGGLQLVDATPKENFKEWWFSGHEETPPKGRSLICNIPLGSVNLGEFGCIYLDYFKKKFRFILCAPECVKDKMLKLADTKLKDFGFHDYQPV